MTRDEAIVALVERDVARWGESERAASQRRRGALSHGRAINALAHYDADQVDRALAEEARRLMTAQDWRILRSGE